MSSTEDEVVCKLKQEYQPRLMPAKAVCSLVSLALEMEKVNAEEVESVRYRKDMLE